MIAIMLIVGGSICIPIITDVSIGNRGPDRGQMIEVLNFFGLRPHWHPTQAMAPPELRNDCPKCFAQGSLILLDGDQMFECHNRRCELRSLLPDVIQMKLATTFGVVSA